MKTVLQEPVVRSSARVSSAVFISSLNAAFYTSTRTGHRKKMKEESAQDTRKQKQQQDTVILLLLQFTYSIQGLYCWDIKGK